MLQVATPWEIRQQAQEIREQLIQGRGALSDRLAACEAFMAEHGEALIPVSSQLWLSITEVLSRTLQQQGLADDFAQMFEAQAQAAWKQAERLPSGPFREASHAILQRWPLTQTATHVRRQLANVLLGSRSNWGLPQYQR